MKFATIAMLYTILLDMLIFTNFSLRQNEMYYELDQRIQDMQVNYATDAAAYFMLTETNDIGIDYQDLGYIRVDPEVAVQTYEAIMVRSFGWGDSEFNREMFENGYMPFFIVAGYDGYYVYEVVNETDERKLNGGATVTSAIYPKQWTCKIPYAKGYWDSTDIGKSKIAMFTLGGETYNIYDYSTGSFKDKVAYTDETRNDCAILVSQILSDACNKALVAAKSQLSEERIWIPNSFSKFSSNRPVEYPTVLTYLDVGGDTMKYSHVSFAVGGTRIEIADFYICYIDENGNKKYSRGKFRNDVEKVRGCKVKEIATSAQDAAHRGYYFDLKYLE